VAGLLLVDADSDLDGAAVFPGVCRRWRLYRGSALHDIFEGTLRLPLLVRSTRRARRFFVCSKQEVGRETWISHPPLRLTNSAPATPPARPQENGILYGVAAAAGVVGLIGIIVVEKTLRIKDLVALGMGLSNTFALSVGLLLMGYGLVEIPRETWKSEPEQMLKWCAHRCVAGRWRLSQWGRR